MQTLFIAACLAVIAVMLWTRHALMRVGRGPAHNSWFPGVLAIGALILVYDWSLDQDEAARLAMEREVVRLNECPGPAPGLSDTVAMIVNAPAGAQPRLEHCFRMEERAKAIRERAQRRKDTIAEAR